MNYKVFFILIPLILSIAVPMNHYSYNSTGTNLNATVSIPGIVYEGENFTLYINGTEPGLSNYTFALYIAGDNLTGITTYYHGFSRSNGNFSERITAPDIIENLYFMFYEYAYDNKTNQNYTYERTYTVSVQKPIVLSATIKNVNKTPVNNVTVYFYLDGTMVGSTLVKEINANSNYTANITVPSSIVPHGENTLSIRTNSVELGIAGQDSVKFYYGKPPNYDWIYYIAGIAIVFAAILIISSGRRTRLKVPKWKRNKGKKK
ncbi:CARDB domain-containing protein [Picrophilus oshimae]|uniref:Hypothetical membrane protein n=1 Tax=Picrophilus torridus (strain ATCC 700027 / DSM 9790 / JCM 10055 / NBRC 100828 / KAW 2/3) TaxID=1122961 RepID=Q6L0Y0_PICTO|nr:CARDB domain-containing protein [Picrophilus oshimae]AAT43372.1 hypothetical membrane protein [Picrophilus oshimae DSM 9789]